jgi:hypothetical protein
MHVFVGSERNKDIDNAAFSNSKNALLEIFDAYEE